MGKTLNFEEKRKQRELARASKSLLDTMTAYAAAVIEIMRPITQREIETMRARWGREDMSLSLVRDLVGLWVEAVLNPNFTDKAWEVEELIEEKAKRAWGEKTTVEFLPGSGIAIVTCDHRRVVIDEHSFVKVFEENQAPRIEQDGPDGVA